MLFIFRDQLFCLIGKHIDQPSAPERLHDDDGYAFRIGCLEADAAGLAGLVEIVVLDLTEIPVVVVQDFQEHRGIAVVGKTEIADGSRLLLLFDPAEYAETLQVFPLLRICKHVHQVVIDVVRAQALQLFIEIAVKGIGFPDQILRHLGGDIDFIPQAVFLEETAQGIFASRIDIRRVKIVYAPFVCVHQLAVRLVEIDHGSFAAEAHTAVAEYRDRFTVFIVPVLHPEFLFILFLHMLIPPGLHAAHQAADMNLFRGSSETIVKPAKHCVNRRCNDSVHKP